MNNRLLNPKQKENKMNKEELLSLKKEGKTNLECSKIFNVCKSTISNHVISLINEGRLKKTEIVKKKAWNEGTTKNRVKVKCSYCNKEKIIHGCSYKRNVTGLFYCNQTCRQANTYQVRTCQYCNDEYKAIRGSTRKYCSHKCSMEKKEQTFKYVKKRDGSIQEFDINKIIRAIGRSGKETGEFDDVITSRLAIRVVNLLEMNVYNSTPEIEQIQDIVEDVLLTSPFKKTAKSYILYREQHARLRDFAKKANLDLVDSYLNNLDWKVKENSNMGYSLQGLNQYISSEISKSYWLNKIYTSQIRNAHLSGDFHIHDLNLLSVYCVGWDLQNLLKIGFKGVAGKIESKPAKHFRSALGQIVNFFYTLQGEAAGAQAFSNFDTLLAPFIRYDGLNEEEVAQAMQEFIFNINIPTRVGFQTPFTNITLDLQPPSTLKSQSVIIGGKLQKETYAEFQDEMHMFNKTFLNVMQKGDGKGRVFTFPIPTYNIGSDFDWDSPNLETLWEVTAKYGTPYFANFINSDMSVDDARSMCCRLRLDLRHLDRRGGGLFGANPLTGSIGVVTINMARLGHISKDEKEFIEKLDHLLDLAKDSLEIKRRLLESFTDKKLYPYTKYYLKEIKKHYNQYWYNHFSTIGLIGMNEACLNLFGKDIGTKEGNKFAAKILDHMRDKLLSFQEETGNMYNLEATPAEGTSYRLAKLDKKYYPEIISAQPKEGSGIKRPFYSNSTQLPVNYSHDIFDVLDKQDNLQKKYTGGTVLHIFLGESLAQPENLKKFIKKVCENYNLPYFTITPTFSICSDHGYLKGEQPFCPECKSKTEIYSRVVGYLRPVDQWNEGKQAEFPLRSHYQIEHKS